MDELPNNECNYDEPLKIDSEEDLFMLNEETGEKQYMPVGSEDVAQMKKETVHLCKDIQYATEEFQWIAGKHKSLTYYNNIYQNLAEQLADFLKFIYLLHKKVYVTIYKNYDDEIMDIYMELLEKVFNDFKVIVTKHKDFFLSDEGFEQISSVSDCLRSSLDQILSTITQICNHIYGVYRCHWERSTHETYIIYHFIKQEFDKQILPQHLKHIVNVQKHRMEVKKDRFTATTLRKVLEDTEQKYNNYTLCSVWYNNVEEDDGEEELVDTLFKKNASQKEFETLFMYQGEHKMWEEELDKVYELEHEGESFFVNFVDPYKLEETLKFWVKAEIKTQQRWYIVWCLMKYTFHMVKEGQDKNDFVKRMNLMFPDAEKKCKLQSIRKFENKMNHNLHFSHWLEDSDPDYHVAKSLYDKLNNPKAYKRDFDSVLA